MMGKCMNCVDNMCQDRLRECNGRANIVVPSNGGVSVSGQSDSQGRQVVTVCALLQDNSKSCQTIMNPDGVLVSSIENMGDNLMVHLRGAVNDMGGNSVGTFVNGMQTFIGSYRPLSGNGSDIPETELISMLSNMSNQYNAINQQIQSQISNMGEQIQQGMKIFKNVLGSDINQFSSQMNNQMQKLFSSMNNAFNINPTTPPMQQQPRSTTSNMYEQPWQRQQNKNIFNQEPGTSSPFSAQQPIRLQPKTSTQNTMFRAPPTTESNFYELKQKEQAIERTTPPIITTITSSPQNNNPPLPSVLNIDSIIGSSNRNSIPNVVNINSPVGIFHGENIPNINIDSIIEQPRKESNSNIANIDSSRLMSGLEQIMNTANDMMRGENKNKKSPDLEQLISRTRDITQGGSRRKQIEPFHPLNSDRGIRNTLSDVSQHQERGINFERNLDLNRGSVPSVLNLDSIIGRQSGSQNSNIEGLSSFLNGGSIPDVVNIGSNIGTQDIVTERPELPPNFDFLSNTNAGQSNQRISGSRIPNVMNFNSMIGTQNTGQSSGADTNGVEVIRNNPMVSGILGDNFASNMNNLASNLRHSFSDMFGGGGFFGRKKRSVENRRVKRSHLQRPGGIAVGSNPNVGLITKKKKPINKEMYMRRNKWNGYLKGLLPNSVPVRVNPDEGISIRSKKSIGNNLIDRVGDSRRNMKSQAKSLTNSNNAGGLLVYNNYLYETTTVPYKDKSLFIPEMMAMRTNTRVVKRINPSPALTTTTQRTKMSTYQTSPLKLELERIVRALEAKAKERSLSVYDFNPNMATSTIGPLNAIVPQDVPRSTIAVQTMDTTQSETTTESMKFVNKIDKKPLLIQRPDSLQRKEVRTFLHSSVSKMKTDTLKPKTDIGRQDVLKPRTNVDRQAETITSPSPVREMIKPVFTKQDPIHHMDILDVPTETPMDIMGLLHSMSADAVSKLVPETPIMTEPSSANSLFTTTTEPPYLTDPKSAVAGHFYQHNAFPDYSETLPLGLDTFVPDSVPHTSSAITTTTTTTPDIGRQFADITKQRDCGIIYLNATSCLQYREMCSACADHIDSRKGDILEKALNREIRRAFLDIVTNEITASKVRFDELRPSLLDCQDKIQQVVGKCADCVDRECRNRYLECRDSASIIIPSGSGVSVSGRTDRQGRYYVTVCAVLQDNTEACQTIMNPDGVMGSSISNIGNHILVHLQGAMRDMGGVSVGGFVNGMQSFIGNYHPLNGNFSTMNETETKKMVEKMNKQYQQINSQVNEQVQQMNSRINQQVQQNSMNLRRQMNRLNQNLNQMNRRLNNNRMNLNRRMQNMNRNMQAWRRGFNQRMANFGTNLNRQMQTMSYNLGNMFRGMELISTNFRG
ncbi:hypothetical protein FSP39_007814 [Pinctada imbricata]|uniref:Uncharacterized protein n=1 Tax=Pinctada imbricata TaxID=66713 RepID=A0AA89CAN6_PINIB|nr:hypothetical protein FSP39_007814 [Pinctada imbricata]